MISAEDDEKNWDWLPGPYDTRLQRIRSKVTELWENYKNIPQLAWFTPHGPKHCASVEHIMHRLIPDQASFRKLTERERFYLLASAWVHDIGMIVGIMNEDDFHLLNEDIRRAHHTRSENYIVNHYSSIGVEPEDAPTLSLMAHYHGEDLANCLPESAVGTDVVRLRLIAAYLRLADALDISQSRSPQTDYAICLAYNIPMSSKLHWIKSRLINGIHISAKNHCITVHFKTLHDDPLVQEYSIQKQNLVRLQRLVMDDLQASVESNMPTLVRGDITYFPDIDHCTEEMVIDEQVQPELSRLVSNLDMLVQPSATKLMHILLQTIKSIIQTHPRLVNEIHNPPTGNEHPGQERVKSDLSKFMRDIRSQILENRPCHLGFRRLVDALDTDIASEAFTIEGFKNKVDEELANLEQERERVRITARSYFGKIYSESKDSKISRFLARVKDALEDRDPKRTVSQRLMDEMPDEDFINIVLYGFSELVIKGICGFRDWVLLQLLKDGDILQKLQFHKDKPEKIASTLFRVFVCEGQPKTITAKNDRLAYHDGTGYALDLHKRGFNNIMILPDLVVGSLDRGLVDFVLLGVNGLEYNLVNEPMSAHFFHTSGHLAIAVLASHLKRQRERLAEPPKDNPRVVLLLSRSKCAKIDNYSSWSCMSDSANRQTKTIENEGYKFWAREGSRVRTQPFLIRDKDVRVDMFKAGIRLYNPKEDCVELSMVDDVIADGLSFIGVGCEGLTDFRKWLQG